MRTSGDRVRDISILLSKDVLRQDVINFQRDAAVLGCQVYTFQSERLRSHCGWNSDYSHSCICPGINVVSSHWKGEGSFGCRRQTGSDPGCRWNESLLRGGVMPKITQ